MLLSVESCLLLIVKKMKTSVIKLQGCSYSRDWHENFYGKAIGGV